MRLMRLGVVAQNSDQRSFVLSTFQATLIDVIEDR